MNREKPLTEYVYSLIHLVQAIEEKTPQDDCSFKCWFVDFRLLTVIDIVHFLLCLNSVLVHLSLQLFDFRVQLFAWTETEVDLGLMTDQRQSKREDRGRLTGVHAATARRIPVDKKCRPSWKDAVRGISRRLPRGEEEWYIPLVHAKPSRFNILKSRPWFPYSASTRCESATTSNFSGTTPL